MRGAAAAPRRRVRGHRRFGGGEAAGGLGAGAMVALGGVGSSSSTLLASMTASMRENAVLVSKLNERRANKVETARFGAELQGGALPRAGLPRRGALQNGGRGRPLEKCWGLLAGMLGEMPEPRRAAELAAGRCTTPAAPRGPGAHGSGTLAPSSTAAARRGSASAPTASP